MQVFQNILENFLTQKLVLLSAFHVVSGGFKADPNRVLILSSKIQCALSRFQQLHWSNLRGLFELLQKFQIAYNEVYIVTT